MSTPASWAEVVWAALDTETTGADVETDRIVTACIGIGDPKPGTWHPREWLINPGIPIPDEAAAIHGITTEKARAEGVDPKIALAEIRDAIAAAWRRGWVVVGYNVTFDLTILDRDLRRHGLAPLDHIGPVVDPLVIDKATDTYRQGSRKLVDVAAHYGIRLGQDAHSASPDAFAAMRLAFQLTRHLPICPNDWRGTLDEAHRWQADAYREQRISLAKYFRTKKGDEETAAQIESDTHWPIRPWTDPQQELIAS